VFIPNGATAIDLFWDEPGFVHFASRLGQFSRATWYEFRGTGVSGGNGLDNFVAQTANDDLEAVLSATGCERAVLVGAGLGGPTAIRFAALHPERVGALVLIDTFAHYVQEVDYPYAPSADVVRRFTAWLGETWGEGSDLDIFAPTQAGSEERQQWLARRQRLGLGAGRAKAEIGSWMLAACHQDVRELLSSLRIPTLVLHRAKGRIFWVEAGRYLAEHISGAKFVELPGEDQVFFDSDADALVDEIEEFLTGVRQGPEGDVVNAAVLFTDIVSSTEQATRMSHRAWSSLIDDHDAMVRAILVRFRGHEVRTMGDGFLATFDSTTRAVRAAVEIIRGATKLHLEVRAGIHTGDVEMRPGDVLGLTVNIAKRICDLAGPGQVFVSEGVRSSLTGSGIASVDQGAHRLKGVPHEWRVYGVTVQ
jgi:class 3 adenylate cyclase